MNLPTSVEIPARSRSRAPRRMRLWLLGFWQVRIAAQHLVVLLHPPRQAAGRDVQEMQVLLELVEDVADDVLLAVAIDVVMLPAAAQ